MADWLRVAEGGIEIDVLAVPRSSRSRIMGIHDDCLRVQLAAAPSDGEANEALVELIASELGVKRRTITLLSGHASRRKRIRIEGVAEADVRGLAPSS